MTRKFSRRLPVNAMETLLAGWSRRDYSGVQVASRVLPALLASVFAACASVRTLRGADCNSNGIEDALEILSMPQYAGTSMPSDIEHARSITFSDWNGDGSLDFAVSESGVYSDLLKLFLNQREIGRAHV